MTRNVRSTFRGMDTFETTVTMYTTPFSVVYTPDMTSIYDKDTVYEEGIHTGVSDYMRVNDALTGDGRVVLNFVRSVTKTSDHVDKAAIVGTLQVSATDLKNLIKLLQDKADELSL